MDMCLAMYDGLQNTEILKISVIHMYSLNQLVLNVGRNSSVLVAVMLTTLHWVEIYKRLMSLAAAYKETY